MKNEKMIKTAGTLHRIVSIVEKVFFAMAIVCLVFAVLVGLFGERMFAQGKTTLDLDFLELHLSGAHQQITPMVKLYTVVGLISGVGIFLLLTYGMRQLLRLLEPMTQGRPFSDHAPVVLRKMAVCVFAGGAVLEALEMLERILLTKIYPFEQLLVGNGITKVEYVFEADFGFLLFGAALLLLSYIFAYGNALQLESDETL